MTHHLLFKLQYIAWFRHKILSKSKISCCYGWEERRSFIQSIFNFIFWFSLAVCAAEDIRSYRVPNKWLFSAAAAAFLIRCGPVWPAGGAWECLKAAGGFLGRMFLVTAFCFPVYTLGMAGAADVKLMALIAAFMGLERGTEAIMIGLISGAVPALIRMLRQGSVCQRFLYLTAYIGRMIREKKAEMYYNAVRDGRDCVIPLGAFLCLGAFAEGILR